MVLDPGGTCGVGERNWDITTSSMPLNRLPEYLADAVPRCAFVVCETFILRPNTARFQTTKGSNHMPAAQGIGMARMACHAAGIPLYMASPGAKTAGRKALDEAGLLARAGCRNEHERDVVDLIGYVLRELRRPHPKARTRS